MAGNVGRLLFLPFPVVARPRTSERSEDRVLLLLLTLQSEHQESGVRSQESGVRSQMGWDVPFHGWDVPFHG